MLNVYTSPEQLRRRAIDMANRRRDHLIRQELNDRRLAQQAEAAELAKSQAEPSKRKRGRPRKVQDAN